MNFLFNIIKIIIFKLIIKIIEFIKNFLLIKTYKINKNSDSFFFYIKIQNHLIKIFNEFFFLYSFIPILNKYKLKKKKINEFISSIYFSLITTLTIISIILIFFYEKIIFNFFPILKKNLINFEINILILKIIFPFIMLISLITLILSILNVNILNIFFIIKITQSFINLNIIFFIIFFKKFFISNIYFINYAIIIGNLIQLLFQQIYLYIFIPINISIKKINIFNTGLIKVIKNIYFLILIVIINKLSKIINNLIYYFFKNKYIHLLYYSSKFIDLPSNIIISSINTILLSKLPKKYHKKNFIYFSNLLNYCIKIIFFISFPISLILIFISEIIISILFKYNNFLHYNIINISELFIIYSIGLFGFILSKLLYSFLYSIYKFKKLIFISIKIILFTQIINLITIFFIKHIGLAISTTISPYLHIFLLYKQIKKEKIYIYKKNIKHFIKKIFLSTLNILIFLSIYKIIFILFNIKIIYIIIKIYILILITFLSIIIYIISLYFYNFKFK